MDDPQASKATTFISYRRSVGGFVARAVYQRLRQAGYDVFMDVESINAGTFDTIILEQIAVRTHFLVILTPGTLDRCVEPRDWLRREVEQALATRRTIVPLFAEGFQFKQAQEFLTGDLAALQRQNGITLYLEYFEAAMDKLIAKFLSQPVTKPTRAVSAQTQQYVEEKLKLADELPTPVNLRSTAEYQFSRGYQLYGAEDYPAAIDALTRAIEMNPSHAFAFTLRGVIRYLLRQPQLALDDFNRSLMLDPDDSRAYGNRGNVLVGLGDTEAAIADYDRATEIDPTYDRAFYNRGLAHRHLGIRSKAIQDFRRVLEIGKDPAVIQQAKVAIRNLGEMP